MNYKKINKDNYTLHLINTDRFKTISVSLKFTKRYDKEESAYYKLLERVLPINGTKNYKSVNDITKKLESLYSASIGFRFYVTSENMTFESNLRFINPKYTEESMYEESFNMFKEILTKPNLKNKEFKYFDLQKDNLIKSILNVKDDIRSYSSIRFSEIFYKNTVYAENNYKNIKDFENINSDKLYAYYKNLFNSFKLDLFVLGDISEEERDYKLILYNTILGCMNNSLLFVNVREKNSLCYSVGSNISKFTETIIIKSGISKDNFELAVKLIKESLEEMKDTKKVNKLLKNAKKTLNLAYNDFYENKGKIIEHYFIREFINMPTIEERRKKLEDLTAEDVTNIANKITVGLIYLLEGKE